MEKKILKELNTQLVGWVPISYEFGRDEIFCEIEDDTIILAAAGLAVAGLALALSKDDNWMSKNELIRVCIPGSTEIKMSAAKALCDVGHWAVESRDGLDGWRLGVDSALQAKRQRYAHAKKAADARYAKAKAEAAITSTEENPFD